MEPEEAARGRQQNKQPLCMNILAQFPPTSLQQSCKVAGVCVCVTNYTHVYQITQRPPEENYREEGKQALLALGETLDI